MSKTITFSELQKLERVKEGFQKIKKFLQENNFNFEDMGNAFSVYKSKGHPLYEKENDDRGMGNLTFVTASFDGLLSFCYGVSAQSGSKFDVFIP